MPARSPIPLTDTCACSAPFSKPVTALAAAIPKSSWVWTSTRASVASTTAFTVSPKLVGIPTPQVSGMLIQSVPASLTASTMSIR